MQRGIINCDHSIHAMKLYKFIASNQTKNVQRANGTYTHTHAHTNARTHAHTHTHTIPFDMFCIYICEKKHVQSLL